MFKIGEFSRLGQVSVRMLRYYDNNGLLQPETVDPFTGYRMYTAKQLPILRKIIVLRDMGFSIVEIKQALSNWTLLDMEKKLKDKNNEIEFVIRAEKNKREKITNALQQLPLFLEQDTYYILEGNLTVAIKEMPSFPILSLRKFIDNYFCEEDLWKEFGQLVHENNIYIEDNSDTITFFHGEDDKKGVDVEVAVRCTLIPDFENKKLTQRLVQGNNYVASVLVEGPFTKIGTAYHLLASWLEEHPSYEMQEVTSQICHKGPWNTKNENDFITEVLVPLHLK